MNGISSMFANNPTGAEATQRVVEAYTRLFEGTGDKKDADIVLVDLAAFTGFMTHTVPAMSEAAVRFAEGQRSVAARIASYAHTAPAALADLAHAVQQERHAQAQHAKQNQGIMQ